METLPIEGKLVRLRIAAREDAEFTLSIRQDGKNIEHMPKLNVDAEQQKKWITAQAKSDDCYFFVVERLNGEKIGTFSLYNIVNDEAESGRLVLRGNQIESIETCILFHDFSYSVAGMAAIHSEVEVDNMAANGLATRLGGQETGRIVNEKTGIEMIQMRVTREEYYQMRKELQGLVDRFSNRNSDLQKRNSRIREKALIMALNAGKSGSHLGGSLSCLEIFTVLYGKVLHYDLNNKTWQERDRFLASKAHCVLTQYATLSEFGFINEKDLGSFHENDGLLAGHPYNLNIGMEFSGGSLGMGLSMGIGMAIVAKEKKQRQKVYVLLGDGECNEGAVWEAIMAAPKFQLDNLVAIIDYNNMQFDGTNDIIMNLSPLDKKLAAFGWKAVVCDGHNIEELENAFASNSGGKPLAVIAHTIKANGIKRYENQPESHHCVLSEEDYRLAVERQV